MSEANPGQETPTLSEVLRYAVEARLFDLHTALPGIVTLFDPKTQTASVQPALKRMYEGDDQAVPLPVLTGVPIVYPRGSGWRITGPLAKGDSVLLVFSERALDVWKKQGGVVDPADPRKFHLSDAYAIPGGYDQTKNLTTVDASALRVENGTTRLEVQPGGKFRLEKVGGDEVLSILSQITAKLSHIADKLSSTTVNTQLGPQQLLDASDFGTTKGAIDELQAKLDALRG